MPLARRKLPGASDVCFSFGAVQKDTVFVCASSVSVCAVDHYVLWDKRKVLVATLWPYLIHTKNARVAAKKESRMIPVFLVKSPVLRVQYWPLNRRHN